MARFPSPAAVAQFPSASGARAPLCVKKTNDCKHLVLQIGFSLKKPTSVSYFSGKCPCSWRPARRVAFPTCSDGQTGREKSPERLGPPTMSCEKTNLLHLVFVFCVLCFLKDTVLAGVSRRFRVARPIRTDRCLRRTLRLVIRPRSVASVSGAGTLTSCRGAIGLLPRQVHGRIRCRGR